MGENYTQPTIDQMGGVVEKKQQTSELTFKLQRKKMKNRWTLLEFKSFKAR